MQVSGRAVGESMMEAVAEYEKRGYTGQFGTALAGMVQCHTCQEQCAAEQVPLLAAHRFEGASDPAEEAVVLALECPHCGALGTLVLPYGPGAGLEDAVVLAALLDDRDQSNVPQGI